MAEKGNRFSNVQLESDIKKIYFDENYEYEVAPAVEYFLTQKRYYEGLRFRDVGNPEIPNNKAPFPMYKLGCEIAASPIVAKSVKDSFNAIGLRIDGKDDFKFSTIKLNFQEKQEVHVKGKTIGEIKK